MFQEAGGAVPDRNVERMLRNTFIPVPAGDTRRMDLVVPGLNVARGLTLFCDVTVLCPLTTSGAPRPGASNVGGSLLSAATRENNATYADVTSSGLGVLYSLGAEVFGRWSCEACELLEELARERTRGLNSRLRRSTALGLLHRWAGILGIGLQRGVCRILANRGGEDLDSQWLEPSVHLADLALA